MVSAASFLTMCSELGSTAPARARQCAPQVLVPRLEAVCPLLHRLHPSALSLYQEHLKLLADIWNGLARAPSLEPRQEPLDSIRPGEPSGLAALHRHFCPARELCLKPRAAQVPALTFCALLVLESLPPIRSPSPRVSVPARHLPSMSITHRGAPWIVTTAPLPCTNAMVAEMVRRWCESK